MPGRKAPSSTRALSTDNGDGDSQRRTNDREGPSGAEDGPLRKKVRWGESTGSGGGGEEGTQDEESSENRENVS